ncbi:hypothetical protein ACFVYD_28305 [Streptomyces sp. NPDC058301]|uniref:hypothetical protein n=1 Tax=Streptomyces sp. NPDC058301 TaxID=3346436 RepID=UPI0036E09F2B
MLVFLDRLLNRLATRLDRSAAQGSFSSGSRTPWWRGQARRYGEAFEEREERRNGALPVPTARPMKADDWPGV